MALPASFATHRIGSANAVHTLELYLDLICPFSKKQLAGVRNWILPLLEKNEDLKGNLQIILRQTPQPWHASSTLVHEAVLGVSKVAAEKVGEGVKSYSDTGVIATTQAFFFKLIDGQQAFYDEPTSQESPNATRERLADLAAEFVDREKFLAAVKVGKSNGGTPVTNDLKLAIKYGRQNGVHVTPTVALDGLIDGSISSSYTEEDWKKYLLEKVLPPGSKL
ncbi:hypothetical protein T439DRAFT_320091 [Meredithblackwellia eburnea MCA 4105]